MYYYMRSGTLRVQETFAKRDVGNKQCMFDEIVSAYRRLARVIMYMEVTTCESSWSLKGEVELLRSSVS